MKAEVEFKFKDEHGRNFDDADFCFGVEFEHGDFGSHEAAACQPKGVSHELP